MYSRTGTSATKRSRKATAIANSTKYREDLRQNVLNNSARPPIMEDNPENEDVPPKKKRVGSDQDDDPFESDPGIESVPELRPNSPNLVGTGESVSEFSNNDTIRDYVPELGGESSPQNEDDSDLDEECIWKDYDGISLSWSIINAVPTFKTSQVLIFSKWNLDTRSKWIPKVQTQKFFIGSVCDHPVYLTIVIPDCLHTCNFEISFIRELFFSCVFDVGRSNQDGLCNLPMDWDALSMTGPFLCSSTDWNAIMTQFSCEWKKFFDSTKHGWELEIRKFARKLLQLMSDQRLSRLGMIRKIPNDKVLDAGVVVDVPSLVTITVEKYGQKSRKFDELVSFIDDVNVGHCADVKIDLAVMSPKGFVLMCTPFHLNDVKVGDMRLPFITATQKTDIRSKYKYAKKEDSPVDLKVPVGVWAEGKDIPIGDLGKISKLNFYCSNKSVLSGNGKNFSFDGPLVGLKTFIHSQTREEKSGIEKTFGQRLRQFEYSSHHLLTTFRRDQGRYRMEFRVTLKSITVQTIQDTFDELIKMYYLPIEKDLTNTKTVQLSFVDDMRDDIEDIVSQIEHIKADFSEEKGTLDSLVRMNMLSKRLFFFGNDHPRYTPMIETLSKIMTCVDIKEKNELSLQFLKKSVSYLKAPQREFCTLYSIKEADSEEIARWIHATLIQIWLKYLGRAYDLTGNKHSDWKYIKAAKLKDVDTFETVLLEKYFQDIFLYHKKFKQLKIKLSPDLKGWLWRIMQLNRCTITFKFVKNSSGSGSFNYAKPLIVRSDEPQVIVPILPAIERNKAAQFIYRELQKYWGLIGSNSEERLLEFRQSHVVTDCPSKSIKKAKGYEWWAVDHLLKFINQYPKSEIGKMWRYLNGHRRTIQDRQEILNSLKNIFIRNGFTFLHVVHFKGNPKKKYIWRTDTKKVVKKSDGTAVMNDDGTPRTISRSMIAISFIEKDDAETKLNDECSFSRDVDHLNECMKNDYVSSFEPLSDEESEDVGVYEGTENGNSDDDDDDDELSEDGIEMESVAEEDFDRDFDHDEFIPNETKDEDIDEDID